MVLYLIALLVISAAILYSVFCVLPRLVLMLDVPLTTVASHEVVGVVCVMGFTCLGLGLLKLVTCPVKCATVWRLPHLIGPYSYYVMECAV